MNNFDIATAFYNATQRFNGPKHRAAMRYFLTYINEDICVDAVQRELWGIPAKGICIRTLTTKILNALATETLFAWAQKLCNTDDKSRKAFEQVMKLHLERSFYSFEGSPIKSGQSLPIEAKESFVRAVMHEQEKFTNVSSRVKLRGAFRPKNVTKMIHDIEARVQRLGSIIVATLAEVVLSNPKTFELDEVRGRVYAIDALGDRSSQFLTTATAICDIRNDIFSKDIEGTLLEDSLKKVLNSKYNLDAKYLDLLDVLLANDELCSVALDCDSKTALRSNKNTLRISLQHARDDWNAVGCKSFYMNVSLDFRARLYGIGPFSPIKAAPMRAGIRVGTKKPIGSKGLYWLKGDIAVSFGQDKLSFDDRVVWYEDHAIELERVGRLLNSDPKEGWAAVIALEPDDCFKLVTGLVELIRVLDHDGPTEGFKSDYIVSYDATSSGTQILSLFCHDRENAINSNVLVPVGTQAIRKDTYASIADIMAAQAATVAANVDKYNGFYEVWKIVMGDNPKLRRKVAKCCLMPRLYSAKPVTMLKRCRDLKIVDTWEHEISEVSFKNYLGTIFNHCWASDEKFAPLREWEDFTRNIARAFNAKDMFTSWTFYTPGFKPLIIEQRYLMDNGGIKFMSFFNGKLKDSMAYSMDIMKAVAPCMTKRAQPKKWDKKSITALSPNAVHTMDSLILHSTCSKFLADPDNALLLVHDSLGCALGRVDDLHSVINDSLVDLFGKGGANQLKVMQQHCFEKTGVLVPLPQSCVDNPPITIEEIRGAMYAYS